MSKMSYKLYEVDYAQKAPSQAQRKIFSAGKLTVPNSEAGLYNDYCVPCGNPFIDYDLKDNICHKITIETESPSLIISNYPTPVIGNSIVEIVNEVGIEGTHSKDETINVDIQHYEKSLGQTCFDIQEEVN